MRAQLSLVLLFALSSAPACKKEVPPRPPDDLTLARIVVNDTGVSFGAEPIAAPLDDKDDLLRPLLAKLEARRRRFEDEHPNQRFAGRTEIEIAPGTPCRAAMSVIGSARVAGNSSFTIRSGAVTLEVPAMPIIIEPPPSPPPGKPPHILLGFHADGSVDLTLTPCLAPFDTVPDASLPALVKEWCGDGGDCVRETHIGCDAKTPFEPVLAALAAVRQGSKQMLIARAPDCEGPSATVLPRGADSAARAEAELNARTRWHGPKLKPPEKHPRYVVKVQPVMGVDAPRVEAFTAAVRDRLDDVRSCYELGLGENPHLQGSVSVRIDINKKGGVIRVRRGIDDYDMPDPLVAACAAATLTNATFPASDRRQAVTAAILFSPPP